MTCPTVVRGWAKPPTVAAVSSAQRNAYHGPTPSATARPSVPTANRADTMMASSAMRQTKTLSARLLAAPPRRRPEKRSRPKGRTQRLPAQAALPGVVGGADHRSAEAESTAWIGSPTVIGGEDHPLAGRRRRRPGKANRPSDGLTAGDQPH